MTAIDAYILIGGRSSRLGRDKAVADLGGQTLAQRAFQTTTEALPNCRVTFVASNEAQFAIDAVIAGGRFIFDLIPGRGPLGGIHAALADAQSDWIFIFACDYPFVSAEMIRTLEGQVSDEYGAVVPVQDDGRLQPLCAFYKTETSRPMIEEIIERPRTPPPLHEIVNRLEPCFVGTNQYAHLKDSSHFFTNVNTDSDLDLARKIGRKLSVEK